MWAKGDLMKLFSLIVMFGLICTGCGQGSTKVVETNKEQESEANTNEQNGEVTLTHKADDDEKVFISYDNPQNEKKVKDFEIQPGQCLIFKKEQVQFVKNIKMGRGGYTGISGFIFRYISHCGPNAEFSCNVILDNSSYEIIDVGEMFDRYQLKKQSERNMSTACQYLEDLL